MENYKQRATIRQRAKKEEEEENGQNPTPKAPKNGEDFRFVVVVVGWAVGFFVLFAFAIGLLFFRGSETPAKYQREMGRECDEGTGKCVAIGDFSKDFGKTWRRGIFYVNKSTFAFEQMFKKVGAEAILKCPATDDSSDRCVVDHGRFAWAYTVTMAIMAFVVGALSHPSQMQQQTQSAMVVGLGGGTFDMFLHKKMPNLNITIYELDPLVVRMARKWFGTEEDSTRHTIVQDGIVGIEKAAENGEQFDLVALDACEMFNELLCPVSGFFTEKTLRNTKAILKPTGAFVVNVLMSDEKEEQNYVEKQKRKLLNIFPTCLHTMFVGEMPHVFVCLNTKINASEHAKLSKEWQKKREELAEEFGVGEHLSQYQII